MNRVARNAVYFPLLGAFAAFMAGCAVADTGAFTRLQDEMMGLKKEMAVYKTAAPPAPSPDADGIGSVRKSFADLNSDFDRLRADQLAATTRMDEARDEMKRITARQDAQDRAPQEIRGNADRMKEIEIRLAALEDRIGKLAAAPAAVPAPAAPESPRGWKSPEEMYEVAVGQVKGGNPKKGRETLSDFAAKYPGHKLIPNALYWKGEAFFAEKDFENAILTFQDVVDKYPRGEKAPDAMYKQGLSFLALKDTKNARILLDLVPKKYPKSKAAEMAKKKLKEIR